VELTAAEVASATGGELVAGTGGVVASSFAIDSRVLAPGACFVALEAKRDGHEFVADAFLRGATIALVSRTVELPPSTADAAQTAVVRVRDPLAALGDLAREARRRLEHAEVVGITGSAGKTVTKDLTAGAVGAARRVHASPGSFNNEAGLPLTLLTADPATEVVVAEMGARFAGNIAELCEIARPTIGVVTHVGLAHAQHLGGRAGIVSVKGELLAALPASGVAVLNADDVHSEPLAARTAARVLRAGSAAGADVRAVDLALDADLRPSFRIESPWGEAKVTLAVRGEHQVANATLAATVGLVLGVPIDEVADGLAGASSAAWRMDLVRTSDGVTVLNDAYNSSPTSAAAALRALAALPVTGRRVAVLGEMLELGDHSAAEHAALGALAAELGIDVLIAVGPPATDLLAGARRAGGTAPTDVEVADAVAAVAAVADLVHPGDAVLVKASRAVGLERVAAALMGEGTAR
jgi:UDP-N-acetylmuramoyl-tripeptide--D-alanyl-D-alanine ligase